MKPKPFELFCMYHLGVSPTFETRFYNVNSVARHYQVSVDTVQEWLAEYTMEAERFPHMDFNVAKAHGKVQGLALEGSIDEVQAFCASVFKDFVKKLDTFDVTRRYEDMDYEDLWDTKKK